MAQRRAPATWAWASALAVAVFATVGTFGATGNQPERRDVDVLCLLLVLAGPAALAVRDRWPVPAAAVCVAAADGYLARGYAYGPVFVAVVVGLVSAVLAGQRRATWVVAAVGYAGFLLANALDPRAEHGDDLLHLSLVAGWLVGVLAVADVVRGRREQRLERTRAAHEEQERRRGEQRLRLAQDLHDVLAHTISQINVQASVALHLLDEQPERARPALGAIKTSSHEALQELRTALDLLRRGDDDPAPLVPAPQLGDLPTLVEGVRAGGLVVTLDQAATQHPAAPAVQLAAYRIVQEALTNVTRHAEARTVAVRVGGDATAVEVEVVDDGRGGAARPGNGLTGMHERAASVGGHVEAGPAPGGGFRVAAWLPAQP